MRKQFSGLLLCAVGLSGLCTGLSAQAAPVLPDLDTSFTKLEVDGTGSVEAPPDEATAALVVQTESSTAASAQTQVNDAMRKILATARETKGVTASTGSYSVYRDRNAGKNDAAQWQVRQSVSLTSKEAGPLLDLVGKLQSDGVLLEGVNWSLSPDHDKTLRREAEKKAVEDMRRRAEAVAADLGMKISSIAALSVQPEPFRPMPVVMFARRAASEPSVTPEKQTVTASVHATVLLK